MSELEVKDQEAYKELIEHEYVFSSGMSLPILLDFALGDSVEDQGEKFTINLCAKPSMTEPNTFMPAERVTIFKGQLAAIHERTRKFREPSTEEKFAIHEVLHKLSKQTH